MQTIPGFKACSFYGMGGGLSMTVSGVGLALDDCLLALADFTVISTTSDSFSFLRGSIGGG